MALEWLKALHLYLLGKLSTWQQLIICLDTLNSYMEVLRGHIGLLYGSEVVDRLSSLGLHKDDCRLAGMLIELAGDERIATLDGCDFLRICNVRLMGLLNSCHLTHEGLVSQFVGDQTDDLQTCMISIEYVYGRRISWDFKDLVTVLVRTGSSFEDAVRCILHGDYSAPSSWADVYLQKDDEYRANRGPLFENLQLDSIESGDEADVNRRSY
jgi:hypothetical protein